MKMDLSKTAPVTLLVIFAASCARGAPLTPTGSQTVSTQAVAASTGVPASPAESPGATLTSTAPSLAPPIVPSEQPAGPGPAPAPAAHPILGDPRVRQGIAACTDRLALIHAAYPVLGALADLLQMDALLPEEHPYYPGPELQRVPYDAEAGQALFEAAGWTLRDGDVIRINRQGEEMRLSLISSDAPTRKAWVEQFVEQMTLCGLRVEALYLPAEELYAVEGALAHRQFDLAAISRVYTSILEQAPEISAFRCAGIPSAENGWQGQNFAGWCSDRAEIALRTAAVNPSGAARGQAIQALLVAYAQDNPGIPLFRRPEFSAARADLQNFNYSPGEAYTWNAAQWRIPGKDTIVMGERSEPATLSSLDPSYVNQLLAALVQGLDYTKVNGTAVPLALAQMPTLDNGGAVLETVKLGPGSEVVDTYLRVTFAFKPGLTWSDGAPVVKADYELAHKMLCDADLRQVLDEWMSNAGDFCDLVEGIEFVDDHQYQVTWKPGYFRPAALLPPLGRQPSHLILPDGRSLNEVPPVEWVDLLEVSEAPLGIGPYRVVERVYGEKIELEANPYYYGGKPATERIVIRFISAEQAVNALISGQVDLLGPDTIGPDQASELLDAIAEGGVGSAVELTITPSTIYELLDIMLFMPSSR